jgi:hypothetical protein
MSNNKIFNRNFDYSNTFRLFNENILDDRSFNNNNDENDSYDLNNRILDLYPSTNKLTTETFFRELNKKNINMRKKMGKQLKEIDNIVNMCNDYSMKLIIYYQYYNKSFVCSSYGLLCCLSILLLILNNNKLYNDVIKLHQLIDFNCTNILQIDKKLNEKLLQKIDKICKIQLSNKILIKNNISFKINIPITSIDTIQFYDLIQSKKINVLNSLNQLIPYYYHTDYELIEIPCNQINFSLGILLHNNINEIIIPPNLSELKNCILNMEKKIVNIKIPLIKLTLTNNFNKFLDLLDLNINNDIIQNISFHITGYKNKQNNDPAIEFKTDHPFIYYIRNIQTNTIIIQGVYN